MITRDVAKRSAVRVRVTFVVLRRPVGYERTWGCGGSCQRKNLALAHAGLVNPLSEGSDWPLLKSPIPGVVAVQLRVGLPLDLVRCTVIKWIRFNILFIIQHSLQFRATPFTETPSNSALLARSCTGKGPWSKISGSGYPAESKSLSRPN